MNLETPPIPLYFARSTGSTAVNRTGDWSFIQPAFRDRTAPCSEQCPCGTDLPRVEALAAAGRQLEAWRTILLENPLPGVCGRVCFHPCEQACNRGELDAPVAIHALERFLADQAALDGAPTGLRPGAARGRRVAVLGAGPAGLAAAAFLARLGYGCDLFEAESEPGGVLRWGIPAYRLPGAVLAREILAVEALGVRLHCNAPRDASLDGFDAVAVACGLGRPMTLGVPGEDLAQDGMDLLRQARSGGAVPACTGAAGASAAVIGGGNTAIDVARTLLRQGVRPVIVYRRRREDMPAFAPEVERALAEGAGLLELRAPLALARDAGGIRLSLQRMQSLEPGPDGRRQVAALPETEELRVDAVYRAVGAEPVPAWAQLMAGLPQVRLARSSLAPGPRPIAFIGDLGPGPNRVSDAIASGKEAALALDAWFEGGPEAVAERLADCRVGGGALSFQRYLGARAGLGAAVHFSELNAAYFRPMERALPRVLPARVSVRCFEEVDQGLDPALAAAEAGRCFSCGACNGCDNCRTFCPDVAVLLEGSVRRIDLEHCKGCGVCVEECPRGAMAMSLDGGRP